MELITFISVMANIAAIVTFIFSITEHFIRAHLRRQRMSNMPSFDICISPKTPTHLHKQQMSNMPFSGIHTQKTQTQTTARMSTSIHVTIKFFY